MFRNEEITSLSTYLHEHPFSIFLPKMEFGLRACRPDLAETYIRALFMWIYRVPVVNWACRETVHGISPERRNDTVRTLIKYCTPSTS